MKEAIRRASDGAGSALAELPAALETRWDRGSFAGLPARRRGLKPGAAGPDTPGMFFPSKRPAVARISELSALRRSMNNPVVAIEELPSGPASAAVALHALPDAQIEVTIAVRSERSRQLVFFTAGPELTDLKSPGIAMDAALSFAEGMGFLFDDDEVEIRGARGPAAAAGIWLEFIQAAPESAPEPGGAGQSDAPAVRFRDPLLDLTETVQRIETDPGPAAPLPALESTPFGPSDIEGPIFDERPSAATARRRSTEPPREVETPGRSAASRAESDDPEELPFWLTIPESKADTPHSEPPPLADLTRESATPRVESRRSHRNQAAAPPTQPILFDAPGLDWADELGKPVAAQKAVTEPLRVALRSRDTNSQPPRRAAPESTPARPTAPVSRSGSASPARQAKPSNRGPRFPQRPRAAEFPAGDAEEVSASRDLLLDVLAQTTVEQVCPPEASERRLSKFRWRGAGERMLEPSPEAGSAQSAPRKTALPNQGSARDNLRLASLRLRLLSRF